MSARSLAPIGRRGRKHGTTVSPALGHPTLDSHVVFQVVNFVSEAAVILVASEPFDAGRRFEEDRRLPGRARNERGRPLIASGPQLVERSAQRTSHVCHVRSFSHWIAAVKNLVLRPAPYMYGTCIGTCSPRFVQVYAPFVPARPASVYAPFAWGESCRGMYLGQVRGVPCIGKNIKDSSCDTADPTRAGGPPSAGPNHLSP